MASADGCARKWTPQRCLRTLAAGASLSSWREKNVTPIAVAAAHGHIYIIKALVARGAGIEAISQARSDGYSRCSGNPDWPYSNGFTALHIASLVGEAQTVMVLLQLGANPNSSDTKGVTPIMVACLTGFCGGPSTPTPVEMLDSLLKAGADPTLENETGLIAIHFAASQCDAQVVELLLSKVPSTLNHATHDGWTPLSAAAEGVNESAMSHLISAGASDLWAWAAKGLNSHNATAHQGKGDSARFLLENGLEAVGGKLVVPDAMLASVMDEHMDVLEILLNVE